MRIGDGNVLGVPFGAFVVENIEVSESRAKYCFFRFLLSILDQHSAAPERLSDVAQLR